MRKNENSWGWFIALILIIIVIALLGQDTIITQKDIEENTGSFSVIYNDDGTIQSLDGDLKGARINDEKDALNLINKYQELFQLPSNIGYKCINIQDTLIGKAYMFIQTYQNVEIAGTYVVLTTNGEEIDSISTDVVRHMDEITLNRLSNEEIQEIVEERVGQNKRLQSVKEIILGGKLTYYVYVVNSDNIFELDDMKLFIDADTREVKTEREVAKKYNTIDTYYDETQDETSTPSILSSYLFDPLRNIQVVDIQEDTTWPLETYDYMGYQVPLTIASQDDELGSTVYENLATVYDWYKDRFGRVSYDNKNGEIVALLGVDSLLDNAAYWDAFNVFIVGEVHKYDKSPAEFLDVIAHEYTHAMFKNIAGDTTIRNGTTEGINEAYADIFGCLIDGDWVMAEGLKDHKALSDFTDSGIELVKKRNYPETYKGNFWSQTDGHINSRILTKIAYKMTQNGFTEKEVAEVWYQSMFYGYSDNSDYITVRYNIEKAMRALGYEANRVEMVGELFEEVNIGK